MRVMMFFKNEVDWILSLHTDLLVGRVMNRRTIGSMNNRIAK